MIRCTLIRTTGLAALFELVVPLFELVAPFYASHIAHHSTQHCAVYLFVCLMAGALSTRTPFFATSPFQIFCQSLRSGESAERQRKIQLAHSARVSDRAGWGRSGEAELVPAWMSSRGAATKARDRWAATRTSCPRPRPSTDPTETL